jgi:Uma2 family endonuclease
MRFCAANEMVRVERDVNGELILMSPGGSGAGQKNSELIYQLAAWARETNSGATFDSNAGFTLPDGSMRSPDAAWIAWPRWNALSKKEQDGFAPICPEFVNELRSPSDSLTELQAKMRLWAAHGAEVAWLVDPARKMWRCIVRGARLRCWRIGMRWRGMGRWRGLCWSWGGSGGEPDVPRAARSRCLDVFGAVIEPPLNERISVQRIQKWERSPACLS